MVVIASSPSCLSKFANALWFRLPLVVFCLTLLTLVNPFLLPIGIAYAIYILLDKRPENTFKLVGCEQLMRNQILSWPIWAALKQQIPVVVESASETTLGTVISPSETYIFTFVNDTRSLPLLLGFWPTITSVNSPSTPSNALTSLSILHAANPRTFFVPLIRDLLLYLGVISGTRKGLKSALKRRLGVAVVVPVRFYPGKEALNFGHHSSSSEAGVSHDDESVEKVMDVEDVIRVAIETGSNLVDVKLEGQGAVGVEKRNSDGGKSLSICQRVLALFSDPRFFQPLKGSYRIITGPVVKVRKLSSHNAEYETEVRRVRDAWVKALG